MVKRLQGKVAVVTAAGQGIGRAIAEAFVREGATVWATDRDTDKLDGIAKAKRRKLDVLSDKAVANFAEKVGPIDILVNAAGFVHHGTVMECDSVRGIPNRYVYGATKAAVIGLTKAVAADYIKKGIRANAICPGTIQSPSLDERIEALAKSTHVSLDAARQAFIDRQPMGRLGTAEEIAMLAVYLASDEASYTTGQIHLADGGFAL